MKILLIVNLMMWIKSEGLIYSCILIIILLLSRYPLLKEKNIGQSRDTTFEEMIMKETKGQGVDVVLNSLADDKLLASIRCVKQHGHFLEIGKYDLMNNTRIGIKFLLKNIFYVK